LDSRKLAVHFVQVAGEQGRFLAARPRADFHDAPRAVGIFAAQRHSQQIVPDLFAAPFQFGQLRRGHFLFFRILTVLHRRQLGDFVAKGS